MQSTADTNITPNLRHARADRPTAPWRSDGTWGPSNGAIATVRERGQSDTLANSNTELAEALTEFQTSVRTAEAAIPGPAVQRRPSAPPRHAPLAVSRDTVGTDISHRRLRIAQLAPLAERVPPALYGGTERVVSALTEELVRRGHEVTLFASGDSCTSATLIPACARALRLDPAVADVHVYTMRELGLAFAHASEFDVIHNHLDYFALPFTRLTRTPVVTTMHGRLDLPDLPAIIGDYRNAPLISISDSQRAPLRWANWVATVHNGIDLRAYPNVYTSPGDYFAFLGRISPEKNIEAAIRIARATGIPLKIAAKVDRVDRDYYEAVVKPLIDGRLVEYIGEIGEHEKNRFLGQAYALLFPVDWPEPFGLAMIEAMACGTPVLALRRGAIPEVIDDAVTGFVRDTEEQLAVAAWQIPDLDRRRCRRAVEARFSVAAMADGYEAAFYAQLALRFENPLAPGIAMSARPRLVHDAPRMVPPPNDVPARDIVKAQDQ